MSRIDLPIAPLHESPMFLAEELVVSSQEAPVPEQGPAVARPVTDGIHNTHAVTVSGPS